MPDACLSPADALWRALQADDPQGVRQALGDGAGLSIEHPELLFPLAWTVQHDRMPLMILLLELGADPRQSLSMPDGREGMTVLMMASQLGRNAMVEHLLACPAVDPEAFDGDGRNALHWAAAHNQVACTRRLLAQVDPTVRAGSQPGCRADSTGNASWMATPLDDAVATWSDGTVDLLLPLADPAQRARTLGRAMRLDPPPLPDRLDRWLLRLIEGADLTVGDPDSAGNLLNAAVIHRHPAVVERLVRQDPGLVIARHTHTTTFDGDGRLTWSSSAFLSACALDRPMILDRFLPVVHRLDPEQIVEGLQLARHHQRWANLDRMASGGWVSRAAAMDALRAAGEANMPGFLRVLEGETLRAEAHRAQGSLFSPGAGPRPGSFRKRL